MPDILANPNALPARADMQVRSDGILDLANFVAEVVPTPDSVLASLGGDLREYGMLRRDDQVAALMQQRQDKLVEAEWEVIPGGDAPADVAAADFLREQLTGFNFDAACRKMHGSLLYGYGVAECLWGRDGSRITLRDIRVRALAFRLCQRQAAKAAGGEPLACHAAAQILAGDLERGRR